MRQRRLMWLLAMMGTLALTRFMLPPVKPEMDVADPIVRPSRRDLRAEPVVSPHAAKVEAQLEADVTLLGDPFRPRTRPAPEPPAAPPASTMVSQPILPSAAAAVPIAAAPRGPILPPIQIIGTYIDDSGPGVFIATGSGVQLARVGSTVDPDFRVTSVSTERISFEHLTAHREVTLAIEQAYRR